MLSRRWSLGLALVVAFLAGCSNRDRPAGDKASTASFAPCQLSAPGAGVHVAARCTTVTVSEKAGDTAGRQIPLRVAVVPSLNRAPDADPMYVLVGGPGQAATEAYPLMQDSFAAVHRDRDIVLVDQRGTGSSNALRCPSADSDDALADLTEAQIVARTAACRTQLEQRAELTEYTTARAVDDLEQVRAALGHERINLYGISYGTRVAQEYLRRHPAQTRSVVLDGVVPPDEPLGRDMAADAQRAVELIAQRCAGDAACHEAFPSFSGDLAALRDRLVGSPAAVALVHPISGTEVRGSYGEQAFGQTVRLLSYAPETAALLPLLVHRALDPGDVATLAAGALLVADPLEAGLAAGMSNSVVCSEDLPFFTAAEADAASRTSYLGATSARLLRAACDAWPRGQAPAEARTLVSSTVPVLLLSGEADPVTPPENGERVATALPNSRHLVAVGQGHGVAGRGCLPRVMADFVAAGSVAGLDAACVDELAAPPFFLTPAGGTP
jgi:pimeloyl-ACP methyl ester carboxylesterase